MSSMYGATGAGSGNKIPKGYQQGRLQQFTPEQTQLLQSMFGDVGGGSYLSRLASGDQSLFAEMEAPALKQFSELQGGLASRFSGMGQGGRHSSGFQNAVSQSTSDFAQNLAAKRQGLQSQAIKDLWGMKENLLGQRPYENFLEKKPDFWSQILGGAGDTGDALSKILKLFMGG